MTKAKRHKKEPVFITYAEYDTALKNYIKMHEGKTSFTSFYDYMGQRMFLWNHGKVLVEYHIAKKIHMLNHSHHVVLFNLRKIRRGKHKCV